MAVRRIPIKHGYIDEYTGGVLDPILIRVTIMEQLNYFNDKQVWQLEHIKKVEEDADAVHVRSCWVLCNQERAARPGMRARFVACE